MAKLSDEDLFTLPLTFMGAPFGRPGPSTRAAISSGRCRLKRLTATIHTPSIRHHSSNEPSCPPHAPATLYGSGSAEFEWLAT